MSVPAASIVWLAAVSPAGRRSGGPSPGAEAPPADPHEASAAAPLRGCWLRATDPALPLDDRGLLLADGLFETVLLEQGRPRLLAAHLERWRRSAALLALQAPPQASQLRPLLAEAVARGGIATGALRLNWSRGSGGRGLDSPEPGGERFWLQLSAMRPSFLPLSLRISRTERRNADSCLSRCKTFAYAAMVQARREARAAGADDALLLSTSGELCCGSAANLLVRLGGRWLTPPLTSDCLPGVMRGRALALGLVAEARLEPDSLAHWEAALLINSLGCRPIARLEDRPLPAWTAPQAERWWRQLLVEDDPA